METLNVEDAAICLSELIKNAVTEKKHVKIKGEEGDVVLLPSETYENLLVALELLATPGLMDSLKLARFKEDCQEYPLFLNI